MSSTHDEDQQTNGNGIAYQTIFDRLVQNKIVSTQSELARMLGLGRAGVSWVASKRGTVPDEWERRFEDAGYSWRWVSTGEGPMFNAHQILAQGKLEVVRRITGYKHGAIISGNTADIEIPLHTNYLSMIGIDKREVHSVYYYVASGDAMSPLIGDGDICFIDTGNTNPVTSKLYLVAIGEGILEVRRLLLIGADLVLNHINPIYPNVPFNADTMTVTGRVAAVMTKV